MPMVVFQLFERDYPVCLLRWPPYVVRSQNANVLKEKLHD
jgi:hypothetical protein